MKNPSRPTLSVVVEIKGFPTERDLEEFAEVADLKSAYDDPRLKSAIVFDGLDDPDFVTQALNGSFPKGFRLKYRIRPAAYDIATESIFQWLQFPGPELGEITLQNFVLS